MKSSNSPAVRRYQQRLAFTSLLYVLAVFLAVHVLNHGKPSLPTALGLASIPSIPLVLIIVVIALYLKEEKDDFQRELFIRALLWGTAGTLAITSFWGFVHLFTSFPPVDGLFVYVLFWVIDGIAAFFLRLNHEVAEE